MNRTALLFALLALMFGAALVVTLIAFTGGDEKVPPEEPAAAGREE